jgi:hypothetical protein
MRSYSDYLARKQREHGAKFDSSDLAAQFVPYYESGARIKVRTHYGEEITGTVGVTTGWRPCFLLMRRSNSFGSSDLMRADDRVIAVQRGRTYRPL